MRWAIYYDDNSVFTSEDGAWEDAPLDGVLFVLQKFDGDIVHTQSGADFYYLVDDTAVGTGDLGPFLRSLKVVKFGRWTSIKRYEEVSKRVTRDAGSW